VLILTTKGATAISHSKSVVGESVVGRSFRNANQVTVVGQGINLSSPDTPVY